MALNYPGPYEIRFYYDVTPSAQATLEHILRFNCQVYGDPPSPGETYDNITLVTKAGNTRLLADAVDDLVALWRATYGAESNLLYSEFWVYEPNSFDASFVSTEDISLAGTNANPGTSISAYQEIYTFRTQEGGTMRLTLMETKESRGAPKAYAALATHQKAWVDYLVGNTNVALGRDTSYPFSFTKMFPGENEAIFKKRFRL